MGQIKQFDTCYVVVNDKGKPISDPFLTFEEAERFQADLRLDDELERDLREAVSEWADRKAAELGLPRVQIYRRVVDVRLGDYGWAK
jgi:hypothetical protein